MNVIIRPAASGAVKYEPRARDISETVRLDSTDGGMFGADAATKGVWVVSGPTRLRLRRARVRSIHRDNTSIGFANRGSRTIAEMC
jgi:hypothetical protein